MMRARKTMMARTTMAVAAAFLPDRQQSTKDSCRRNGGGNGNGNGDSDGNSNNNNGQGQGW
jgi:hypothetical protein